MEVGEVKIGDLVYNAGVVCKIQEVYQDGVAISPSKIKVVYDDIDLIHLTKDVLEKNGWSRNKNENYVNKKYSFIEIYPCSRKATEFGINVGDRCMIIIDSVHELQHILWALGMDDGLKI